MTSIWMPTKRTNGPSRLIADRHYSRQKPGTKGFVKPGRCFVLEHPRAVWVTSWPFAQYVKHAWAGAWECSMFRYEREEGDLPASDLIRSAVAFTRSAWPNDPVPELGMVTFIDTGKVNPIKRRGVDYWGYSYLKAGFKLLEEKTKGGLIVFQLLPGDMPEPMVPWKRRGD